MPIMYNIYLLNNFRYQTDQEIKLLDVCSFLDPRTKSLPYLSATERAAVQDNVYVIISNDTNTEEQGVVGDAFSENSGSSSSVGLLESMFQDVDPGPNTISTEQSIKREIISYTLEQRCSMQGSPLDW